MTSPEWIFITFSLLAMAIPAVWLPVFQMGDRFAIAPWAGVFATAMTTGAISGVLSPLAIIALGLLCVAAWLARTSQPQRWHRIFFGTITAFLALALALHRIPGFHNLLVISNVTLSAGAAAFTQYANFDKGAAGLLLLALMCRRTTFLTEWRYLLKQTLPVAIVTIIAVLGAGVLMGYVKPDFKIPQVTLQFLVVNLLFAVIAEEAFFRGFLQDRLALLLSRFRYGRHIAVICSALLFGLAHIAGGPFFVLLASLSGIGYAYAYHVTQRIEAPVIVHFALNAVHFVGFTYPNLLSIGTP